MKILHSFSYFYFFRVFLCSFINLLFLILSVRGTLFSFLLCTFSHFSALNLKRYSFYLRSLISYKKAFLCPCGVQFPLLIFFEYINIFNVKLVTFYNFLACFFFNKNFKVDPMKNRVPTLFRLFHDKCLLQNTSFVKS